MEDRYKKRFTLIDYELKEIDKIILTELRLVWSYRKENELQEETKKLICCLADSIREI